MNNILSDLDDFIAPSQECIKMIVPQKNGQGPQQPGGSELPADQANSNKAQVLIGNDFDDEEMFKVEINPGLKAKNQKRPDLIKKANNAQTGAQVAKISLQDCLACNGCVTSAETVLI